MENLNHFGHLQERAISAHNWTSFSPDVRGKALIGEMNGTLEEDFEEIKAAVPDVEEAVLQNYKSRFEQFLSAWIGAKSRCASAFIAGPSNFPVRRAQKANRSEQRHYEVFSEWRKRAKKAIIRKAQPEKTYNTEIERYKKELAAMQKYQDYAKAINKIVKSAKKSEAQKVAEIVALGYTESEAQKFMVPDWVGRVGIPSYRLTNNNANMRRVEGRIKELEAKEAKAQVGNQEYPFAGGVVVMNYEENRIQIKHDKKPEASVIQEMKRQGFKWAPSQMAWQRFITSAGIYATNRAVGVEIPVR